ncbi:MAG TPA: ABC transporter permease [Polyangiales bacterium]
MSSAGLRGGLTVVACEAAAVAFATCLFGVFLLIVGAEPFAVLGDMFEGAFGSSFSFQNSLVRAAPLMLTALCTLLPARIGMVVIGNEGALLAGGLAAASSAVLVDELGLPGVLPLALAAGALAGALVIILVGALRAWRGVNETISSLLLFYIVLAVFLYLVEGPLRDPASLNKPSTLPVAEAHMMGNLPGLDVHGGLALGVIACLLAHVWIEHTRFGFAARVVGGGPRAAQLVGLPVHALALVVCAVAGAAAGLAGAVEVVAVHGSANASLYAGYGFAGILVAFVARHHALAVLPVALFLGGIEASGGLLQRRHDLPDAAVDVFKGLVFLAVLGSEPWLRTWLAKLEPRVRSEVSEAATLVQAPAGGES